MAQGESWEIGVAVPVKNHTFQLGQNYSAILQESIGTSNLWFKVDSDIYPEVRDIIQYNDQVLLGPSSVEGYRGETEFVQISGYEQFTSSIGKIQTKNKNNKVAFNTGDKVTFYGTGLGGGWSIPIDMSDYIKAEGIKMGVISRHEIAGYPSSGSNPPPAGYYNFQQNGSLPYITISRGTGVGIYGYFIDWVNSYNEYLINPLDFDNRANFASVNGGSITGTQYFVYGDYHQGGWRKDNAQRIRLQLKNTTPSGNIFQQELLRPGPENLRERVSLIPYQYYRMGSKIYLDDSYLNVPLDGDISDFIAFFLRVDPMSSQRNGYQKISKVILPRPNVWQNVVSTPLLLKSGISNIEAPTYSLYFTSTDQGSSYTGDILIYIDDIWLEHAGGVNYSEFDGCLKFSRYSVWPEAETIKIEKFEDPNYSSLFGKKTKLFISCRFNYVSQAFWDQFEILMSWQEKGYSFNLHPYINDIPYVIIGKITIKEYVKDSWNLGLRSFTMEFMED